MGYIKQRLQQGMERVRGAGGGGKGGGTARAAQEAPDTLQSRAYARVALAVSEGPIVGLVNGFKSIYFDGVPVENADGSRNFNGFKLNFTLGTPNQAAMPGFASSENEVGVGVEVKAGIPIVRTVTNPQINRVRVTLGFPQMTEQNTSNGDLFGSTVEYAIDVQSNGGGYVTVAQEVIRGKCTSRYQLSRELTLTGSAPWDIRVRRLSADAASTAVQNKSFWDSYTEVVAAKMRRPFTACFGVEVDAQQLSRVPTIGFDLMGYSECRVPVNYDPITRVYSGVWNGQFKLAWTNNPAWIWLEVATNPRFGAGKWIDVAAIDKWALYSIAQYCDAPVPNGAGGTEPRFTCNVYLQQRAKAFDVLRDLAAVFRGMVYWDGATITPVQDAPRDPVALFTNANVAGGDFEYTGTTGRTRFSSAIVWWNNPGELYKRTPEYYEDPDLVALYGPTDPVQVDSLGCTSRGQAQRMARWIVRSQEAEPEVVAFIAGNEGNLLRIGDVIKLADRKRAGKRMAGRIKAATASLVTLDEPVALDPGVTYTLSVMHADGGLGRTQQERGITNTPGMASQIGVTPPFSQVPQAQGVWLLAANNLQPTLWSVRGLKPNAEKGTVEVVAARHEPTKFAAIENNLKITRPPVSRLNLAVDKPKNLNLSESLYTQGPDVKVRFTASWEPGGPGQRFRVYWRRNLGAWNEIPESSQTSFDLQDVEPGQFTVRVAAINVLGTPSPEVFSTLNVLGKTAPPPTPTAISVTRLANGVRQVTVTLPASLPDDVATCVVRFASGSSINWPLATTLRVIPINKSMGGSTFRFEAPEPAAGTFSFAARLTDTSFIESAGQAQQLAVALGDPPGPGVWAEITGRPANLTGLTGAEAIQNSQITIVSGNVQGIGTGNGTAVANTLIGINASGQVYGMGAGNGITVSNQQISIDGAGRIQGIGAGVTTCVDNTRITGQNFAWGAFNTMVAGPGQYGSPTQFTLKDGANNPFGLQPGETLTVSADLWRDAIAAADGAQAVIYIWSMDAGSNWTLAATASSTSTTPSRQSVSLTLPASEAQMVTVAVNVYKIGSANAGTLPGTVNAARVQVERGPVATQYSPGQEPGATVGAQWGSNLSGRPSNLAGLAGSESIRNDLIGINASGQMYGLGAGNGIAVSNGQISVGADGRLTGIGTGNNTPVSNDVTSVGGRRIAEPNGGFFSEEGFSLFGAIYMVLPAGWTDTMLRFDVEIYEYSGGAVQTYSVGGYTWSGPPQSWLNHHVSYVGSPAAKREVRLVRDTSTGRPAIIIGRYDGQWQYPKVRVRNLLLGFVNFNDGFGWGSPWTITRETSRAYTQEVLYSDPRPGGAMSNIDAITNANAPSTVQVSSVRNLVNLLGTFESIGVDGRMRMADARVTALNLAGTVELAKFGYF